jgi:diguanylate cyclase (GGDEF)-like protein
MAAKRLKRREPNPELSAGGVAGRLAAWAPAATVAIAADGTWFVLGAACVGVAFALHLAWTSGLPTAFVGRADGAGAGRGVDGGPSVPGERAWTPLVALAGCLALALVPLPTLAVALAWTAVALAGASHLRGAPAIDLIAATTLLGGTSVHLALIEAPEPYAVAAVGCAVLGSTAGAWVRQVRRLPRSQSTIDASLARVALPAENPLDGNADRTVQEAVRSVQSSMARTLRLLTAALRADQGVVVWFDAQGGPAQIRVAVGLAPAAPREVPDRLPLWQLLRRQAQVARFAGSSLTPGMLPWLDAQERPGAALAVGLFDEGIPLGALVLHRMDGPAFDDAASDAAAAGAESLVASFQSERLLVEVSRTRQEMNAVHEAVEALARTLTVRDVGRAAFRHLQRHVPVDLLVLTEAHEDLTHRVLFAVGEECEALVDRKIPQFDRSLVHLAVQRQHVLPYTGRVDDAAEILGDSGLLPDLRSVLVFPLTLGGRAIGTCIVGSMQPDAYPMAARDGLSTIVAYVAAALGNALSYSQAIVDATTDGMTGLTNHRTFKERGAAALQRADRSGRPLCLLLTDIDFFKKVNDTHGHATGDVVIRAVAEVLRNSLRRTDIGARYGGEEFAVLLEETDLQAAFGLAERIRTAVGRLSFDGANGPFAVTLSLGIAQLEVGEELGELIERADQALYRAKRGGRNQSVLAEQGGQARGDVAG